MRRLKKTNDTTKSYLLWWFTDDARDMACYDCSSSAIDIESLTAKKAEKAFMLQILHGPSEEHLVDDAKDIADKHDEIPLAENQDLGADDGGTSGRLTPITEGSREDEDADAFMAFVTENFGNYTEDMLDDLYEVWTAVKTDHRLVL